jgi:exportin-5
MKQRIIRLVVDISSKALDKAPSFALKVLEHILMTHVEDHPQYPAYSEAVKELHSLASHELRRLSMRYADYFFVGLVRQSDIIYANSNFQDFLRCARA